MKVHPSVRLRHLVESLSTRTMRPPRFKNITPHIRIDTLVHFVHQYSDPIKLVFEPLTRYWTPFQLGLQVGPWLAHIKLCQLLVTPTIHSLDFRLLHDLVFNYPVHFMVYVHYLILHQLGRGQIRIISLIIWLVVCFPLKIFWKGWPIKLGNVISKYLIILF